jgi:DNA helicase-2/ATP-dependent DNA helicase PcrA
LRFSQLISDFSQAGGNGVAELLTAVLERTHYGQEWRDSNLETEIQRAANVEELRTAAVQYDAQHPDDPSLAGFLEETALVADVDALDDSAGMVTLMTLHAAKGLEFPVVFVVAVEEGVLPHDRATRDGSPAEMEEERRLLFVGATRAEQRLFLTHALIRTLHGKDFPSPPSRFLHEMQLAPGRFGDSEIRRGASLPADIGIVAEGSVSDGAATAAAAEESPSAGSARLSPKRERKIGSLLLTTGADLLNGTANRVEFPAVFEVGMRVRHPQLGPGQVVEAQGTGKWRTVTVVFQSGESVSYVVHKCPLQPIGAG